MCLAISYILLQVVDICMYDIFQNIYDRFESI